METWVWILIGAAAFLLGGFGVAIWLGPEDRFNDYEGGD